MAGLCLRSDILKEAQKTDLRQRRNMRRIARYTNQTFAMSDNEFQANYRLTKQLFNELCRDLEPLMPIPTRVSDISSKYKILIALSFFATGSYQRLVGGTHGTLMSQQSVSRAIRDVTVVLNSPEIINKFIKFPQTRLERNHIKIKFYEKFGFPSVVGCIDGTHVAIIKPREHAKRFFNRKHYYSRNVLFICDAELNILSVDASFGGASHDSFVWNQHPVKENLINLNSSGEMVVLLGGSGYAQREYMMTPIINAAVNSPEEYYNRLHCTAHNVVEHTIGTLKNRWRCLLRHRVLHYHPDMAAKIINACCVLHNICNRAGLNIEDQYIESKNLEIDNIPQQAEQSESSVELRRGIEVRANLVHQLWAARRR